MGAMSDVAIDLLEQYGDIVDIYYTQFLEVSFYLKLPAIQTKLSNYAKAGEAGFADEGLRDVSLKGVVVDNESSKYINDYDAVLINEEIEDTARNETIYKMPLPKELQKEILSKPKKMSKIKIDINIKILIKLM